MIKLSSVLDLESFKDSKIHLLHSFSNENGSYDPLTEWLKNEKDFANEMFGYQEKDNWNRRYIINFIKLNSKQNYLFTGVYEVEKKSTLNSKGGVAYRIELQNHFQEYIGRLVINYKLTQRNCKLLFEKTINDCFVSEILREKYSHQSFNGLENINISFKDLKQAIEKPDWKSPLMELKGVYALIDDSNGKFYIGSAYSEYGIWSRWKQYIENYTGGNKGLDAWKEEVGKEHFEANFRFILLEYFGSNTAKDYIIGREKFYKDVFNSRKSGRGYNLN